MKVSLSKAAELTKKSKNTIRKHLKNGTLSGEQEKGQWSIDTSELIRCYGELTGQVTDQESDQVTAVEPPPAPLDQSKEIDLLREQIRRMEQHINSLEKANERQHQLLLTNQAETPQKGFFRRLFKG